jgi:poly-gamma-glutamate synthesis protein (capsule biosynthesis protein)
MASLRPSLAGGAAALIYFAVACAPATGTEPAPAPSPSAITNAPPPPTARSISILGAGDVLLHPSVWRQAAADAAISGGSSYDFGPIFAGVTPQISAASLAICLLETPVGPAGGPFSGYPTFSVPPQILGALRAAGFDSCSTATNHTLDAGEPGVYRTLDALDAAGLRHAGSYRSADEQVTPTILDVSGTRVAHLAYTFGFNGLRRPRGKAWIANVIDPAVILAEARRAKAAGAAIVVVSLHWGREYDHEVSPAQAVLARRLLASPDVDLILGSHTHVVQPLEWINGKPVVYGMGNQIARQSDSSPACHEGVMPRFTFTEIASGHWAVTKVETIATWIDVSPRIRIVDLAAAVADPATPEGLREKYAAALDRITSYLRGSQ